MITAGYNSPQSMNRAIGRTFLAAIAVLALCCTISAASWNEPAALLARDVSGVTGPGTVAFTFKNSSSLTADQVTEIRNALFSELRTNGVRPVDPTTAATDVTITFSENAQSYVWIAEVKQGADSKIVMRSVPRAQPSTSPAASTGVLVRSALIYSQPECIIDATQLPGLSPYLAILEPERVGIYRQVAGKWSLEQSLPIAHTRIWQRDLRGRIVPASDHLFDIYLPGTKCSTTATSPLRLECADSDDPWPLGNQATFFGAARNFFNGVLRPGIAKQTNVAPFYSGAALPRSNYTLWFFAGIDGRVHQYDGFNERIVNSARDWGSGLASVNADCGTFLVATGNADATAPDTLRAYEVADREPAPASPVTEYPGPVTSLWTASDGFSAFAIVHNLRSNQYEAYNVSLACAR
jgi:hypothetical protein